MAGREREKVAFWEQIVRVLGWQKLREGQRAALEALREKYEGVEEPLQKNFKEKAPNQLKE